MLSLPFGLHELVRSLPLPRIRASAERPPRPEPFVEHDPRKALREVERPVTPGHLLGAGGRAEIFRIPE